MPECFVLDVRHGNAAVVRGNQRTVIVDGGTGLTLVEFLRELGIRSIDAVLISHADRDHIAGVNALLAECRKDPEFSIGHVYLNPDPRTSDAFADLVHDLNELSKSGRIGFSPAIGVGTPPPIELGGCVAAVVAPGNLARAHGVGGAVPGARKTSANTLSAVVRVTIDDRPWVLLPGDLDYVGLVHMIEDGGVAEARAMVFPHHGGAAGTRSETEKAVEELFRVTGAEHVVFSSKGDDSRFPSEVVLLAITRLAPIPAIYSIGRSPVLETVAAEFSGELGFANGTGRLVIREPSGDGTVQIDAF